jgi:O-antigen/teichoic acid export membrane protein
LTQPVTVSPVVRAPRLVINYALLSGGEMLAKVLAALGFAYLARVMGPENYGHLEFALAITFYGTLLVDSGLSSYGAREIAKDRTNQPRITAHIIVVRCTLAVLAFAILLVCIFFIQKPWPVKQLILLYGLTFLGIPGLLWWVFQGRDMMQYVAISSLMRWSVFIGGIFLFVKSPEHLWIVPLIELVAVGAVSVFCLVGVTHFFGSFRQPIDWRFAVSIFRQALPIGASDWAWAVKMYSGIVLLGLLVGGPEVGWFGAALRIVVALHAFVWLYYFNLLPSLARLSVGPLDQFTRFIHNSLQLTSWAAILVGLAGATIAGPMIALLFGPDYRESAQALQILIWLVPLAFLSGNYRFALIASGRQHLEFYCSAAGALLMVVLNLTLIPMYGWLGLAWAFIVAETLIWGLSYFIVSRTIGDVQPWFHLIRPLLAGSSLLLSWYLLSPVNIWGATIVGVVIYMMVLVVMEPKLVANLRSRLDLSRSVS